MESEEQEVIMCPGGGLMHAGVNLPVFEKDYESVRFVVEMMEC